MDKKQWRELGDEIYAAMRGPKPTKRRLIPLSPETQEIVKEGTRRILADELTDWERLFLYGNQPDTSP